MSGDDEIAVNDEARDLVRELENHNPDAPSVGAMGVAVGVNSTEGSIDYRMRMRQGGTGVRAGYDFIMGELKSTCEDAIKAIENMQDQDQEIASILRKYELGLDNSTSVTGQGGGGRTSATAW